MKRKKNSKRQKIKFHRVKQIFTRAFYLKKKSNLLFQVNPDTHIREETIVVIEDDEE